MALSGILASVPKHQTTLPVSGKKIEYRPFIVKEEKILFMASESKDEKTINSAIREVISACTGGTVDVFKLPIADMEYLFLQLRSHSVGETAKPNIKCSKCEIPNECEINLKEIKPTIDPKHTKIITVVDDISIQMRYPTMDDLQDITTQSDVERALTILRTEMVRNMKLLGVNSLEELEPKHVRLLPAHAGLGTLPGGN